MISQEEALKLVRNTSRYAHALMVSRMMKELARVFGEDENEWVLVGLLHDLDYDEVKNDMRKHGVAAAEKLKERLPENCIHAIKAHDYRTGIKAKSKLDSALIATDSLASLIEKMGKTAKELTAEKLQAELESISVNRPWYKSNVLKCEEIGLRMDDFLRLCLNSLKERKM